MSVIEGRLSDPHGLSYLALTQKTTRSRKEILVSQHAGSVAKPRSRLDLVQESELGTSVHGWAISLGHDAASKHKVPATK